MSRLKEAPSIRAFRILRGKGNTLQCSLSPDPSSRRITCRGLGIETKPSTPSLSKFHWLNQRLKRSPVRAKKKAKRKSKKKGCLLKHLNPGLVLSITLNHFSMKEGCLNKSTKRKESQAKSSLEWYRKTILRHILTRISQWLDTGEIRRRIHCNVITTSMCQIPWDEP